MPKPKSVTLVMTCPHCQEETYLPLNKQDVEKYLKMFKASARKNTLLLKFKCFRCQKPVYLEITKKQLKIIHKGFSKPSIAEAEKYAFNHLKF
jgi:endogenous inhibitor of DNA gyrase (YacG/DUF329 family)